MFLHNYCHQKYTATKGIKCINYDYKSYSYEQIAWIHRRNSVSSNILVYMGH